MYGKRIQRENWQNQDQLAADIAVISDVERTVRRQKETEALRPVVGTNSAETDLFRRINAVANPARDNISIRSEQARADFQRGQKVTEALVKKFNSGRDVQSEEQFKDEVRKAQLEYLSIVKKYE
jgi:hypothetical protein